MTSTKTDPTDRLKEVSHDLLGTLGGRAADMVSHSMGGLTDRLDDIAGGGPLKGALKGAAESRAGGKSTTGGALKGAISGVKDKVSEKLGGGKDSGGGSKPTKATVIIEQIDVGVPLSLAYNQWTEFGSFPQFMKKVEKVDAQEDTKLQWKAQIVWSHRTWDATILEQVPDERIVWRSQGAKGHVDGAVSFHELDANLTRIVLVLEYYPQGLFERTGNIWRAQGRRARAELQHFRRHVMTRTILHPDDVEGWRGEIHDSEVVRSHEDVVEEEQSDQDEQSEEEQSDEGEYDEGDEGEDEYDDEGEEPAEPEDEGYDEDEPSEEDDYDDYDAEDEAEDEPEDEEPNEDLDEDLAGEPDEEPERSAG